MINSELESSCHKCVSSTLDAYIELDGTFCVKREQVKAGNEYDIRDGVSDGIVDRELDIIHAKEECSKNPRCIGIKSQINYEFFNLCLDSIYKSTAFDKYTRIENYVYKKMQNYGKFSHQILIVLIIKRLT